MRKLLFAAFLIIAALTGGLIYLLKVPLKEKQRLEEELKLKNKKEDLSWTLEKQLEYANLLLDKGLSRQAALAFQTYVDSAANSPKEELALVCYKLGSIYLELEEYEKALSAFYKSGLLNSQADYKDKMDGLIAQSLEKSGLSLKESVSSGEAAAVIGRRRISLDEIDQAIARLPEWLRENYREAENKLGFIKDYVATEVLYTRAVSAGLDKSPQIKEALADYNKQLVLQQFMREEIEKNLQITPADLELYYQYKKERYKIPAAIKVSYALLPDETRKEAVIALLKEGKGEKIEAWIEKAQGRIGEIEAGAEVMEELFKQEKGALSPPFQIQDKTYLFLIEDIRPEGEKGFEEVKEPLEAEYRLKKQEELMNLLLEQALQSEGVKILYQPSKEPQEHKENQGFPPTGGEG